ncbi:MAG: lysophospholipase [Trueperaceae bacterium]
MVTDTSGESSAGAGAAEPFVLNCFDGEQLAGYAWRATDPGGPRGVLLLLHGYAEHAGRHAGLAQDAARAGFDVWAFDQRNHGNSPGQVRGSVDGFEPALADLAALQMHAHQESGSVPAFVFGHSMGGAIALRYALEHPERVSALALSAPFLLDAVKRAKVVTGAAPLLRNLFPSVPTTKIAAETISRERSEVARYASDPLIYHGGVRADAGATMLEQGAALLRLAPGLAVPTLVVHGSGDQVADVAGSRQLAAASPRVTLLEQEGGFHELHHDAPDSGVPQATRAAILEWLEQRLTEL